MRALLRRCPSCGRYTLRGVCPSCGAPTRNPHPPKYSPEDRYQFYRLVYRAMRGDLAASEETIRRIFSEYLAKSGAQQETS